MYRKFVNNIFISRPAVTTFSKLELRIVLPYLGDISGITKNITEFSSIIKQNRYIGKRIKFCKFKITFQTCNRLKSYIRFKVVFPKLYNPTVPINLSAGAAQTPVRVKITGI